MNAPDRPSTANCVKFDPASLHFVPLGGAGEIGMNLSLYQFGGRWLMVDLGVTFADDSLPGVDVILPDPSFIEDRAEDLAGLVLTHAHEDHLGAVPYLWPELRCPVYATPFTAELLKVKLAEHGLAGQVPITIVPLSGRFQVGPFDCELITLTHSIPEPNALVIRTAAGTVLHTGDWKLDPAPVIGATPDEKALRALGDIGVDAMVCDSTNATVPGSSGSEGALKESLAELFGRYQNRIAIACFATNVARLHSIAMAAAAHDRRVALIGRSLWRIEAAARATGYLDDLPPFVTEHDAGYLPKDKLVLVCTGSQGEPRAALARIASKSHPQITLSAGDVVIFSSREIPGNERAIARVQNGLLQQNIEVVTSADAFVHVSGHPARDELISMYQWVRPNTAVPVHGEARHMRAHAQVARDCQVPNVLIPDNGAVMRLAPGMPERIGDVASGRLCLDGNRLVPLETAAVRSRVRIMNNGAAVVTLVVDAKGNLVGDPQLALLGLVEEGGDEETTADTIDRIRDAVGALKPAEKRNDEAVKEAARLAVRRAFQAEQGRKPITQVHLVRV